MEYIVKRTIFLKYLKKINKIGNYYIDYLYFDFKEFTNFHNFISIFVINNFVDKTEYTNDIKYLYKFILLGIFAVCDQTFVPQNKKGGE